MPRHSAAYALLALSAFYAGKSLAKTPEVEKFTPPDLEDASMIACGVGGLADGTAKVFVRVDYAHGRSQPFVPMIGLRESAQEGLQDCVRWIHDLRKPLEEAQARKERR